MLIFLGIQAGVTALMVYWKIFLPYPDFPNAESIYTITAAVMVVWITLSTFIWVPSYDTQWLTQAFWVVISMAITIASGLFLLQSWIILALGAITLVLAVINVRNWWIA